MPNTVAGSQKAWRPGRLVTHAALILGGLLMLYPVFWMIGSSLKPPTEIFTNPSIFPKQVDFSNYPRGWEGAAFSFDVFFVNSAVLCILAIVGNLLACSLTAYAFARLDFPFKRLLFTAMMVTIMLPVHVTLIPQYILFNNLGWVNTFLPIVVPKFLAVDAFFIFLMIQFIRGIPRELDEAAEVDGAGPFRVFFSILLPLLTPAMVTTALFTFIWTYEDFLTPLIYLTSMDKYTVPQGLRLFTASTGVAAWGPMLAMSFLSLIPLFLVFFLFQRRIIDGIATSGLKG